ncbi:hypothetical protein [Flavobacterium sp.]|uniref:hypothetical protein n=1 Tax=Flavobacterium sp. TaxID=239 RepID=UPI00260B5872|nr:hypothetical protein [Flavobacterium sp.]
MKKYLERILPADDNKRKLISVGLTVIISGLLTVWGIYDMGEYGIAMFIFTPVFIGACSSILYGLKKELTMKGAWQIGLLSLGVFTVGLLVLAIEGLICIAMAAPIGLFLTWIGSLIGYVIVKKSPDNAPTTILILFGIIPTMAFIEKDNEPTLTSVVTAIEINADPQTVWKNVVEFPQLDEPTEFIFKTGIAYPINAKIEGTGVGAVRYCNFTTGSFVEPITVWDEPRLLKFNVVEQPEPMKELSFWDIDAPHLHDYFVSKQGQFKLTKLPNGNTLLEGTTWYYHNISPTFYWQIWSNHIIHKIHERVLTHIKVNSENEKKQYLTSLSLNNSH